MLNLLKSIWNFFYKTALSYRYFKTGKVFWSNHMTIDYKELWKKKTHFPHPVGIVIGTKVKLGFNCIIYQNVTIGTKDVKNWQTADYPVLEDDITIFANSVIFGKITIGKGSVIGAGSVVFTDIPPYSIVVGNPAKIIKRSN